MFHFHFLGLKLWSVSHTSIYENSDFFVFVNMEFLGEIYSIWSNDLLGYSQLIICLSSKLKKKKKKNEMQNALIIWLFC